MKILMINSVCGIKSTGRICTDIAEAASAEGYECKIAYGRDTVPEKYRKYALKIGSSFGVKMHAGLSRIFDRSGFYSKRATKKLIKLIKKYEPDVVHLHNLHGYYLNIDVLFKYLKKADKPVIWTLHDCWAFTGHCSYFDAANCDKWKYGCGGCVQKRNYPSSFLFDNSKRNFKRKKKLFSSVANLTVVTPSVWLKELAENSFLAKYPVKVINNGIDTSVFKPVSGCFREKYGLENKKIILGVASVWSERKGFNDFLKLSDIVDENFKIVLVGLSREQINSLPENVIGISSTNNVSELAEIYSAADVFFNPTYEDNYPTVNLEAQACGTPVITYKTGGSVESVPKENVVEQGDIQSAYRLIAESDLKVIKDINSVASMALAYINLYNETINK